jgi:tRNA nucleotidyltransferase (CCA-adding enzyme)
VNDYDIATNATPSDVAYIFRTWSVDEVGKNFGVEVATFRTETYEVVGKPNVSLVRTFYEDASRRDFTINSMAKRIDGSIIDYHGGMDDLRNKLIRAVGNPIDRFKEDPSRILRGLYLASRLGFQVEENTLRYMKEQVDLLNQVPQELVGKIQRRC